MSAPVFWRPDFSRPFTVQTDASNYGIGEVLTQEHDDGEHVISFISRSLNHAERNYSTTQRECLAVIWAIERFRGYLEGYKLTVVTEHHSLIWLQQPKNPTGKLCRWALRLQAFDFDIIHRKGKSHVVPDALSRLVRDLRLEDSANAGEALAHLDLVSVVSSPADKWYNKMVKLVKEDPLRFPFWCVDGHQLFK